MITKATLLGMGLLSFAVMVNDIKKRIADDSITQKQSGNEILVKNESELNSAIASAKPGEVIVMKDGVWHDIQINFNAKSTSALPITLKAQTGGNVILDGTSTLTFAANNLVVDGLFFKGGALPQSKKNAVINFESDKCRLTNVAILDYNPKDVETNYFWVYFKGSYNRMDHCFFKGKSNMDPVVQNAEEDARYNKVDSCYLKDIPYIKNANGREIFRIFGYGHADQSGNDGAFFTIAYNLFDHASGEGVEIISLKSNYNIVQFNTVIASRGGLVGRRGKFNTFEGNFILGQGQEGTTGIRVAGANHRVFNNYIADVEEDGLRLITGEFYGKSLTPNFAPKKKALPKYLQVQNGYFAQNTIINCGGNGIDIGYAYKNHWPDLQMVLFPENNRFINNLVYNCSGNAINFADLDRSPPLDVFSFQPNVFDGNIVFGKNAGFSSLSGVKVSNPMLKKEKDGLYHPIANSPAVSSGTNSDVSDDIEGKVRSNKNGIGATTIIKDQILRHPLTAENVGPKWMLSGRKAEGKF
jgi:poly(beta-D-mannuronate) lyase